MKMCIRDRAMSDIPPIAEVFGALQRLKEQGKIREIGVSNHGVKQMQEVLDIGVEILAMLHQHIWPHVRCAHL